MDIISTKEMLNIMESGVAFSMKRVKYDRKRKSGGAVEYIAEAKLFTQEDARKNAENAIGAGRPLTIVERALAEMDEKKQKDPDHYHHYTRNMVLLLNGHPSSEIRKFHPPLVLEFNGKKVVP